MTELGIKGRGLARSVAAYLKTCAVDYDLSI